MKNIKSSLKQQKKKLFQLGVREILYISMKDPEFFDPEIIFSIFLCLIGINTITANFLSLKRLKIIFRFKHFLFKSKLKT